jgi:pyruvate dehydrogenase E2 component (dihydrolipoamide acetyltransferase)
MISKLGLVFRRPRTLRMMSSFPPHQVVGMPSLSPTMTSGTIGKWNCKVGDKANPGDALAEVETDKAIVTFESQDEFFIAKLLVDAGKEVKVGDPIMVTVEDLENVKAFENFVLPKSSAEIPAASKPQATLPPTTSAAASPTAATPPAPQAPSKPSPAEVKISEPKTPPSASSITTPQKKSEASSSPNSGGETPIIWGSGVRKSFLLKKLAADQSAYEQKYGRSAQKLLK